MCWPRPGAVVNEDQTIRFGSVRYSTPPGYVGQRVWCRVHGSELVIVARAGTGLAEIARHLLSTPGNPRICDEHYPHHRAERAAAAAAPPAHRCRGGVPSLGEGAARWLIEAGAAGAQRIRSKMARAVELAAVVGAATVDQALGLAAITGRFADDDLPAIIDHLAAAARPARRRPPMKRIQPSPALAAGRLWAARR